MSLSRADLFAGFATFFAAPLEQEDVAALRADGRLGCLGALLQRPVCRPPLQRACTVLAGFADTPTATSRLNAAFCRLFLGTGGPQGTVPPCESAWRGTGGRLFQEPTAEMATLLATHGLAVAAECCEPPDHLAIELSLMAALLAAPDPDATAVAALRERLLGWVPRFAAACTTCDPPGFYAALATLLHLFLLQEDAAACAGSEHVHEEMGA
ncbi:Molecular chaperone TorD family protein [Rhodovastum atsumiense]|uniref:Molecular chaperone TorD family protein n=1 Tax=Rhodovastum atsumiense TaxID=504468 RepID=A0A5M6IW89_9PROT|nr:molecular chaperone TorD family protein [Rhodovastum atsumiense]KAA5612552.1 molecular chaperone TorD family protein [Rhodovastum atsumiense]CAH2601363.1 Molecular chaperone TorD family protein [Rhodovastum atsumiense]